MNDNQKLKHIIKTIETDYQIEFKEMDWHGEGIMEYIIHVDISNKGQIRVCINLLSSDIDGSDIGECHIGCDFFSGVIPLNQLYQEFTEILQASNALALRAKKLRDLVG